MIFRNINSEFIIQNIPLMNIKPIYVMIFFQKGDGNNVNKPWGKRTLPWSSYFELIAEKMSEYKLKGMNQKIFV